jgi:Zn-dependent peptidase ImmA (M78 family)/transcriptional regulator with XRE-family HTH domain
MPRPASSAVPVTPEVVQWAIDESGYSLENLATAIKVEPEKLRAWARGTDRPSVGEVRELARQLDRPFAMFLLPAPPQRTIPRVEFRSPLGGPGRDLYPIELRRLREAARLQRVLSWVHRELELPPVGLARLKTSSDPIAAAAETRRQLGVTVERQRSWRSPHQALAAWRAELERSGIFVFMLSFTEDACRGFSLWDDFAPVIAVNTALKPEARAFTLFHEYAHLLTRTPSACVEPAAVEVRPLSARNRRPAKLDDPAERWCERFAAAVLLPPQELDEFLLAKGISSRQKVTDLRVVASAARQFNASLRATALSLIGMKRAEWPLYLGLPARSDRKTGGGGAFGRTRQEVRQDQYGRRTFDAFSAALRRDVVTSGDVLDYLDVPPEAVAERGSPRGYE